ncbi:MAG: hypothetical protein HKN94_05065 [Acidimicrobiales bacterium]|nr:hypothetical protein [Acidimicrobiales bacterium]RZV40886.1 MAG: hypothetical protein EX269_17075 [Acidimicrobiales bacterium]
MAPNRADQVGVWIDRIVTELPEGPDLLELHSRLTVIASPNTERRLTVYGQVLSALQVKRGSHIEVRTETGDHLVALRSDDGETSLIDPTHDLPVAPEVESRLGLISQLNDPIEMNRHIELWHVTVEGLRARAEADNDMINLAQSPLDQLWAIANQIQDNRDTLSHAENEGSSITEQAQERASKEAEVDEVFAAVDEAEDMNKRFLLGAGVLLALAAVSLALLGTIGLYLAILLLLAAIAAGVYGAKFTRNSLLNSKRDELAEEFGHSDLGVQLGRVDELFSTHTVHQKRRKAREQLTSALQVWTEYAGRVRPEILLRERPRIEELAGHIRIINNELADNASPEDHDLLLGLASLLAEMSRKFPTECVPMLFDDLFTEIHPEYHGVLRELIVRATHRRQVVLECASLEVARWAATEAVAGNALLITDQEIPVQGEAVVAPAEAVAAHAKTSTEPEVVSDQVAESPQ